MKRLFRKLRSVMIAIACVISLLPMNVKAEDESYNIIVYYTCTQGGIDREALTDTAVPGEQVTISAGDIIDALDIDSECQSFVKWILDGDNLTVNASLTDETLSFEMPQRDVTIMGEFSYNHITIQYDGNGAEGNMGDRVLPFTTFNKLDYHEYTWEGYTFTGWNTEPDGIGEAYGENASGADFYQSGHKKDETVKLYAQWKKDGYAITWKNEDGTVLEEDENVMEGTMPSYDGEVPVKEDDGQYFYTFTGWDPEISEVSEDKTYTAVFKSHLINTYYASEFEEGQNIEHTGDLTLIMDQDLSISSIEVIEGSLKITGNNQYFLYLSGNNVGESIKAESGGLIIENTVINSLGSVSAGSDILLCNISSLYVHCGNTAVRSLNGGITVEKGSELQVYGQQGGVWIQGALYTEGNTYICNNVTDIPALTCQSLTVNDGHFYAYKERAGYASAIQFFDDSGKVNISDLVYVTAPSAYHINNELYDLIDDTANEPVQAFEISPFINEDDWHGVLDNNNTMSILKYTGDEKKITIPSMMAGYTVNHVGNVFEGDDGILSVNITDGINTLGNTFKNCVSLEKVIIPYSIIDTGNAFEGCTMLKTAGPLGSDCNIEFGWTQEIPDGAFNHSCITEITIPLTITNIGAYAFLDNEEELIIHYEGNKSDWDRIVIGEGNEALYRAKIYFKDEQTQYIYTPDNTTESDNEITIIQYYGNDTDIIVPNVIDGMNVSTVKDAFTDSDNIISISISDGIKRLENTFDGCEDLEYVYIAGSVTDLGDTELIAENINTAGPEDGEFDFEYGWTEALPDRAFMSCPYINEILLPSDLETIGNSAFKGTKVNVISLPDTVKTIGDSAFEGLPFIFSEWELPKNLESIGARAFAEIDSLSYVMIKKNIQYVGNEAFTGSLQLTEITFTGDAPVFAEDAFENQNMTIYYPGDHDSWTADIRQGYGGTITWHDTTINDIHWGLTEDTKNISGGAYTGSDNKRDPVVIIVHDTVNLTGNIEIQSGKVDIVGTGENPILNCENGRIQADDNSSSVLDIKGVTVTGTDYPVWYGKRTTGTVENCTFEGGGIFAEESYITAEDCAFYGVGGSTAFFAMTGQVGGWYDTYYYLENCEISGYGIGIRVNDNGVVLKDTVLSGNEEDICIEEWHCDLGISVSGDTVIEDAVDLQRKPLLINGLLGTDADIKVTNLDPADSELVVAEGAEGYTVSSSDAEQISYVPTDAQQQGNMTFGSLQVSGNRLVMPVSLLTDIYWNEGDIIGEQAIAGGTQNNPVVIHVSGGVTLEGKVTIASGYVKIVKDVDEAAIKSNSWDFNIFTQDNSGSHLDIEGLEMHGSSNLVRYGKRTYGTIENCTFEDGGIYAEEAYVNVINSTFHGDEGSTAFTAFTGQVGGWYDTYYFFENCEISGYGTGINVNDNGVELVDTVLSGNEEDIKIDEWHCDRGIIVAGNTAIEDVVDLQKRPLLISGWLGNEADIKVTNLDPVEDELVVAEGAGGYNVTSSDAMFISYIPLPEQIEGNTGFGSLQVNNNQLVCFLSLLTDIYWNDGETIQKQSITGGTQDNPVVIHVSGNVTLEGDVTIASGYVKIVNETENATIYGEGYYGSICTQGGSGSHLDIDGITFIENTSAVKYGSWTNGTITDCYFYGGGIYAEESYITVFGSTFIGNGTGTGFTAFTGQVGGWYDTYYILENCKISAYETGINVNDNGVYLKDTMVSGNNEDIRIDELHCDRGMSVSGNTEIEHVIDLQKKPLLVSGSLETGADIKVTNLTSTIGEMIVATGYDGYYFEETESYRIIYIPTPEQLAGNAIYGDVMLANGNNLIVPVFYKTYIISDNNNAFTIEQVVPEGEEQAEETEDETGEYFLLPEGSEQEFKIVIEDGYEKTEDFEVLVNDSPVELTETGNEIFFHFTVNGETRIEVRGIQEPAYEFANLIGKSMVLEGGLSLNFFFEIPQYMLDKLYILVMVDNKTNDAYKFPASDGILRGENVYAYNVKLSAKEMRDTISIMVEDDNGMTYTIHDSYSQTDTDIYEFTLIDYLKDRENEEENLRNLLGAMEEYGAYAQMLFGYKTDALEQYDIPSIPDELDDDMYKLALAGETPEGLSYVGTSLVLVDETIIRQYFRVESGHDISEYAFSVAGESRTPQKSGNLYYVDTKNVAAKDLSKFYTLDVTDGENTMSVSYSVYVYLRNKYFHQDKDVNLKNLCAALYRYGKAAETYFENR